jgi:hypothetical protein
MIQVQGNLHKSLFDWYPGPLFLISGKESLKKDILRYWVNDRGSSDPVSYKEPGLRNLTYKIKDSTLEIQSSYRWQRVHFIELDPKNYVLLKEKDGKVSYDATSVGGKDFEQFFSTREKITNLFDDFYSENPQVKAEYKSLLRRTKISSDDPIADCEKGHGIELAIVLSEIDK